MRHLIGKTIIFMVLFSLGNMCLAFDITNAEFSETEIEVHFGVVLKNDNGEPVGFRETTKIPRSAETSTALYGVVVTSTSQEPLTLGAVHIIPKSNEALPEKIMGKPMLVVGRGAIFLEANEDDPSGEYVVEVYINHRLYTSISYEIVNEYTANIPDYSQRSN